MIWVWMWIGMANGMSSAASPSEASTYRQETMQWRSEQEKEFKGRKWFPVDPRFRIEARWESSPPRAVFQWKGKEYSLTPVGGQEKLQFIFKDKTSGKETYGAARFLWADPPQDGKVILDFNRAVNPPCAFIPGTTCPLPPRENRFKIEIRAGERIGELAKH